MYKMPKTYAFFFWFFHSCRVCILRALVSSHNINEMLPESIQGTVYAFEEVILFLINKINKLMGKKKVLRVV